VLNAKFPLVFNTYTWVVIEVPTLKGDRWALAQLEGPLRHRINHS
jgi:hypothetical protein